MTKKKYLVVITLLVIFGVLISILFSSQGEEVVESTQRAFFRNIGKTSCIYVDETSKKDAVSTYGLETKIVEGVLYDGTDREAFVYSLISNGDINTFMHSYADVCLVEQKEDENAYILKYESRQVYFTNEKNVQIDSFTVVIDKGSKEVTVIPELDSSLETD
ncbi:MAG: hypothetical protein RBT33_02750 [Candidatus Dojkabacteria bacterium]|jgi:hypothetical protein|nr:hypothetical protein [Candidatus Dojkabacteria bacterium]